MKTFFKIFGFLIIIVGVGFLSWQAGYFFGQESILRTPPSRIINHNSEEPLGQGIDFSVFWEAWRKLERDFIDKNKINYQEMVYGAINGLVNSLEDPYTSFFTPSQADEFEEELAGKYQGVGMEVGIRDDKITVISPLQDTPAQKAGLKPGDIILGIDDVFTEGISLEQAVRLIRGEKGTEVTLLIQRDRWEMPKPITLERAVIKIPTLSLEIKQTNDQTLVALIKIYQFNRILVREFRQAYVDILRSGAGRIILDLRNNPGGYLDVAQDVAGWFIEAGETVVWQDQGQDKERKRYKSNGPASLGKFPVVVLINGGSASGAEILAGALRDIRGIQLVGEKSFGKGSVQEQVYLGDGSSLKITIAKWLTPDGYSIDEQGLIPNIEVELTDQDWDAGRDPQLEKALEIVNNL